MKITVNRPTEVEIGSIRIIVLLPYRNEVMPNDYPHLKDDVWDITIDVDTGKIQNWPKGIPARDIFTGVFGEGEYIVNDPTGAEIWRRDHGCVPHFIPVNRENGEHLDFLINGRGRITNWGHYCNGKEIARAIEDSNG